MALSGLESATALSSLVTGGQASAAEILQLYRTRTDKFNGSVNAVVARYGELADARAAEADRVSDRQREQNPLHGLPFTVKDSIEVCGLPTTSGSLKLMRHRPERTAPAIARLVEAGGLVFGKTNLPEFAADFQTHNRVFGATSNPWDSSRTCGGSSGGSAAAVAAGLTAFDIGSDIAGSIRIPASYCGVYGHKPSFGIVPTAGHIPPMPGVSLEADLAVFGPIARGARDLDLVLSAIAGPGEFDSPGWTLNLPAPRAKRPQEIRVAYWFEDPDLSLDREVLACLDGCIEAVAMSGVKSLKRAKPDVPMAEAKKHFQTLLLSVMGAGLPSGAYRQLSVLADALRPVSRAIPGRGHRRAQLNALTASHREWVAADAARMAIRKACAAFFKDFDVLLLPVTPTAAPPMAGDVPIIRRELIVNGKAHSVTEQMDWTALPSIAYLPTTVAPAGRTAGGLPVGVQIVGPFLEDRTTIAFADFLADMAGGYVAPPAYAA